jgi:hypothetical protein
MRNKEVFEKKEKGSVDGKKKRRAETERAGRRTLS